MKAVISTFIGFEPCEETDHRAKSAETITGIAVYEVTHLHGNKEILKTGIRPGENFGWNVKVVEAAQIWLDQGGQIPKWVLPDPTVDQVKAEAARRVLEVAPEWRQRNLAARMAELFLKGVQNWTAEEQAEVDAGQAVWDQIKCIRAASNALEAMTPIPSDYMTNEAYWSV